MPKSKCRKKVAVLVLNRDGASFLRNCFRSLLRNTYPPFDIFLIDNCSRDSSVDLTRTHYPMVKIISNKRNLGFAGAYDRVIRELDYRYVVLLNNDTVVDGKWLEALFNVAEKNRHVAACGSKILMMWDRTIIDHAGGMLTMIGSGLDLGKYERDRGEYEEMREVGFGCGCSLLIRRDAYLEVGGFDPDYVIYHEDVDLCWKMRLFGYSIMYVPDSVVYHHVGGGKMRGIENPEKVYLCQKNRLANIVKNLEAVNILVALAASTLYDAARIIRFVCLWRGDLLSVLLKGYLDTFRNIKGLLRWRQGVQCGRRLSDRDIGQFFQPLILSALNYRKMLQAHIVSFGLQGSPEKASPPQGIESEKNVKDFN